MAQIGEAEGGDGGAGRGGYDQAGWTHACGTPSCLAGWAVASGYAQREGAGSIGEVDLHEVYERETGERAPCRGDEEPGAEEEARVERFEGWLVGGARARLGLEEEDAATLFDAAPMVICGGEWEHGGPRVEDAVATLRHSAAQRRVSWRKAREENHGESGRDDEAGTGGEGGVGDGGRAGGAGAPGGSARLGDAATDAGVPAHR